MKTKQRYTLSADASLLISSISRKDRGDDITWEWISSTVGWDVQKKSSVMATVKNRLTRDYNYVLGSMRGVGYKILTHEEVVNGEMPNDRENRSKSAKRSKRKAGTVDLSQLTETQKIQCLAEITSAHITIETSATRSIKQISQHLDGTSQPLAINKAFEALKHNLP